MLPLSYGNFFNGLTDLVQRETWIRIQRQTGQHPFFIVIGKTYDAEFVIDRLNADGLQIVLKKIVDEGGFAR